MSDLALYGVEDVWSPPLNTLARGAGDCEDYAIAKFVALQEAGVSLDDLRIVILRDDIREEDHAVVAARLDGTWLMLDNGHMAMIEDHHVRDYTRYFSSIMMGSAATPTRRLPPRDRADMSDRRSDSALGEHRNLRVRKRRERFNFVNRERCLRTAAVRRLPKGSPPRQTFGRRTAREARSGLYAQAKRRGLG